MIAHGEVDFGRAVGKAGENRHHSLCRMGDFSHRFGWPLSTYSADLDG
jgi:hypothetical protein